MVDRNATLHRALQISPEARSIQFKCIEANRELPGNIISERFNKENARNLKRKH